VVADDGPCESFLYLLLEICQLIGRKKWLLYEPIDGAYTELFAGLSPQVTASHSGEYIIPWGRLGHPLRKDLLVAQKTESEGGTGQADKFWTWTEEQVRPYL